jgi:hypothetical protein
MYLSQQYYSCVALFWTGLELRLLGGYFEDKLLAHFLYKQASVHVIYNGPTE